MTPRAWARSLADGAAALPAAVADRAAPARLAALRAAQVAASTRLRVRSGALRDSIRADLDTSAGAVSLSLSSPLPYAGVQETGGTVRAKPGRKLAIPLPAALDPRGVPLPEYAAGPRRVRDLALIPRPSGRALLARRLPDGSILPLWVLVDRVQIRGVGYLAAGLEAGYDALSDAADQAVRAAWEG